MNIKKKWNEISVVRKPRIVARIIIAIFVVIISVIGLSGILETAVTNSIAIPLLGVLMLLTGIEELIRYKILALICFASSAFILGVSLMILLGV
jgi:hypothetical protein